MTYFLFSGLRTSLTLTPAFLKNFFTAASVVFWFKRPTKSVTTSANQMKHLMKEKPTKALKVIRLKKKPNKQTTTNNCSGNVSDPKNDANPNIFSEVYFFKTFCLPTN